MKRILQVLSAFILVASLQAVSAGAETRAPQSTPELKQALTSSKKTIVFFMNPTGKPCGAQNEVLQKLSKDRKKNFNIAYANATKAEDQKAFYDYGVRSMPSLVLVDSKGNISKVFPPGIQSYETLSQALDSTK
ncbi:MAG: thioredoxin family protein [Nitrospirae bacterium]|nr:thioredoxin family protein [Nitrospirota bacterium]